MSKYTTEVRDLCEELYGWDNHEEMKYNPGYNDVDNIIEFARKKIFDFQYPIFDDNYKKTLETKIIKHYYFREIGAESYGQWKFWLNREMNEIMPYFNQLYKSELLEFNPFYNSEKVITRDGEKTSDRITEGSSDSVSFTDNHGVSTSDRDVDTHTVNKTEYEGHSDSETDSRTTENGSYTKDETDKTTGTHNGEKTYDHWNAFSDTPQGGLNGIESNTYLTSATHDWTNTKDIDKTTVDDKVVKDEDGTDSRTTVVHSETTEVVTSETDFTGDVHTDDTVNVDSKLKSKNQESKESADKENISDTSKYLEYVLGKVGSETYSEMLEKYRKTFLNIDMMVIEKLADLFMTVW